MEKFSVYSWIETVKTGLKYDDSICEEYKTQLKQWILEYADASPIASKTYKPETILYRGRIYEESDLYDKWFEYDKYKECQFSGYDENGSFVAPKEKCGDGRCNTDNQQCLYVGEAKETCYIELRPHANELISIAEIILDKELKIIDLSMSGVVGSSMSMVELFLKLNDEMNRPIRNVDGYKFTQFVSRCANEAGFDGIRYTSAFSSMTCKDAGKNLAIFNFDKCRAISSKLVLVENVEVHIKEK